MIAANLRKGLLLIAEPSIIGDYSFARTVILLAEHTKEGSVGFIINKPMNYTLNDLVPEIDADFQIFDGGPVEKDNLYFIHNVPELIPNSIEISEGIFWGGDYELTKKLINNGVIQSENVRFFLGYSGWENHQLESEMKTNAWLISENRYKSKLIEKSATEFWKEKLIELGGDYILWSNAPENPSFN